MNHINWRVLLAAGAGLAVLVIGLDLALGILVSLLLSVLTAALVYAKVANRPNAPSSAARTQRRSRRPAAPALQAGHEVITVRDLGGPLSEHVPHGTRGVITATSWDGIVASFTIHGVLGMRQARIRVRPDDIRRL